MSDLVEAQERIAACRRDRAPLLFLRRLQLGTIPDEVFGLTWLTRLNVDGCGLTELSPTISALKNLQSLDARKNNLSGVPPEIGQLSSLTELYLVSNQLTTLPPEVGNLVNLTELYLTSNLLTTLPPEIGQLASLSSLFLGANQLSTVPPEIGQLELTNYDFSGNKLAEPLAAALSRGWGDVQAYLRGLADAQKCYEAKLVLVGEGNVGKTSLVAALREESFVENRSTTHGIEVRSFEVDHPEESDIRVRLNSWDFGGQAVYRITHQFFFSRRSLFLVVWWPREGVEQNDVEGWIERIQLRVGNDA
ncbi:MAG: internalin A, partial [Porticoccaceae bacterium]